ncbi:hypothetical protein [Methylobacter sp.]|uniref:hypothetical protein n=1 Tax=Methylobacter sp. TaxID=2051955 RepID=UPI00120B4775|nr:hypothetical protein [Methylobacter sp.]TAK59454.1 MAG: hypothetical protein EPO18_20595 [Methylobacter sp.]
MVTVKTPSYSAVQEALILAAIGDGKGSISIAEKLAADPAMNEADGTPRKVRSIIAKMTRMGVPYERKAPVTKTGEPVTKKTDLVDRIAAIVSGNLDGLDKAPKPALQAIAAFVEQAAEDAFEANETDDETEDREAA